MKKNKERHGFVGRFLNLFTVVYPGEMPTALLLTLNAFFVLSAYYLVKPVREALILSGKGAEFKSYLSAATVVFLIFVVKVFSRVASKVPRHKLIAWVTLFFISNLAVFYVLSVFHLRLDIMGILFFIWIGIFNVMVVAQFWAFANDIYTQEEGKRLFPFVAFGATFGAFAGAKIAGWLIEPIGLYQLMLVTGGVLGMGVVLTLWIHHREIQKIKKEPVESIYVKKLDTVPQEEPLEEGGGFRLVFKKRYLLYIAFFVLLLNFVNTNGEYVLSAVATQTAKKAAALGTLGNMSQGEFIGKFYADFFSIVNLFTLFIQLFLVSRIFRWVGIRGALFVLPIIALGGYAFVAVGVSLLIVKWTKVFENSTDYSLMNTTRHALFLVTLRKEKYKAKAAIDTFFHRAGDVMSAVLVGLGTVLVFSLSHFAQVNLILIGIWIFIGILIAREHRRIPRERAGN